MQQLRGRQAYAVRSRQAARLSQAVPKAFFHSKESLYRNSLSSVDQVEEVRQQKSSDPPTWARTDPGLYHRRNTGMT